MATTTTSRNWSNLAESQPSHSRARLGASAQLAVCIAEYRNAGGETGGGRGVPWANTPRVA